ncbi:MAG: TMEM175 family protein [Pyrinomonadaceae bacterium]
MAESQNDPQSPSTSRIEQFSAGVFAIVITLLVLTLQVPKVEDDKDIFDVLNALYRLLPNFMSFVMSFFFVAVFWFAHHQFFHTLKYSTRTLLWLNNLFLFFITFNPFPTALLGEYSNNPAAVIFFGLVYMLTSLSFAFLRWYGWVKSDITSEDFAPETTRRAMLRSFLPPIVYAVGIVIALYETKIAIALFFITPIILILPMRLKYQTPKKDDIEL